jgi:hypothetical protein
MKWLIRMHWQAELLAQIAVVSGFVKGNQTNKYK